METRTGEVVVAIATPLEAELVAAVARVDERLDVRFEPELLPPARFPSDHRGVGSFRRSAAGERRWRAMLECAEVLFGLPGDSPAGLAELVRASSALRWVQGTAGGTGEQVRAAGLSQAELRRIVITRAGVHEVPLAEFAMLGVLAFTKGLPRLLADKQARHWDHYPLAELRGATLLLVGVGSIGEQVARLAKAFGMRVLSVSRSGRTRSADVDEAHEVGSLGELLGRADAVVVTLPLTDETRGLLDAAAIGRMRPGAILVNVGRGGVIDEEALVRALEERRLAGAALDVFATEPLPEQSPLWALPNVLLSPHTAALSMHENERIVELFAENLRRHLRGEELLGRVDPSLMY